MRNVLAPRLCTGAPFLAFFARSGIERNKNNHDGILAELEGVSGTKAADYGARCSTDDIKQFFL
jgi:hypothetical protein